MQGWLAMRSSSTAVAKQRRQGSEHAADGAVGEVADLVRVDAVEARDLQRVLPLPGLGRVLGALERVLGHADLGGLLGDRPGAAARPQVVLATRGEDGYGVESSAARIPPSGRRPRTGSQ